MSGETEGEGGEDGGKGGDGGGGDFCSGQSTPSCGRTMAKQYPRCTVSECGLMPPSSTLNHDAPVISNDATAGSDAADGANASLKSTGTLTLLVASAYRASDG